MERSNLDIVLEYIDVMWRQHDLERGLTYLSAELAAQSAHATELFDAFSDLSLEVLEPGPIADGDYVVLRVGISGTHDSGAFAGQPASGREIRWESIRIFDVKDGTIDKTWAMQDRLGLMEQLGAVTSTAGDVTWAAGDD